MNKKLEIAFRLKNFAEKKFNGLAGLSRALGMKDRQGLNPYLSGKSFIGGEYLLKLSDLGCDINWLLNGTTINTREANLVKEPSSEYKVDFEKQLEKLELELEKVKARNYDLIEENRSLWNAIKELGYEKQVLRLLNRKISSKEKKEK
ncbi:MAG: hypothetical protein AB1298_03905 [Bacteroidota bacterium]